MLTKNILSLRDKDFPAFKPATDPKQTPNNYLGRYRAAVRLAVGFFYTQEEYEEYRDRILKEPLP